MLDVGTTELDTARRPEGVVARTDGGVLGGTPLDDRCGSQVVCCSLTARRASCGRPDTVWRMVIGDEVRGGGFTAGEASLNVSLISVFEVLTFCQGENIGATSIGGLPTGSGLCK